MTQNVNEAKKSRSFAEQSVFASSIHSSMITSYNYDPEDKCAKISLAQVNIKLK
jgi:hypothetical protein